MLPRRYRTVSQTVPDKSETQDCNLLIKQCINSYSCNWKLIHYKYSAYSGSYAELPKQKSLDLKEELYEVDVDTDIVDDFKPKTDGISKEGYLLKGPEIGKVMNNVYLSVLLIGGVVSLQDLIGCLLILAQRVLRDVIVT